MVRINAKIGIKIVALTLINLFICNSAAIARIGASHAAAGTATLSPALNISRPLLQTAALRLLSSKGETSVLNPEQAVNVNFSLYAPQAQKVYLVGDFNNWQPADQRYAMVKGIDGTWRISLFGLPAGTKYKFFVDGQWQLNDNLKVYPDNHGNLNHLLTAEEGGIPHNVEEFVGALKYTIKSIQEGDWGEIIGLTNIREMYQGMGTIYSSYQEAVSARFGGNIDNLFTYINPDDVARNRDNDLAGCMGNMETLLANYSREEIMRRAVFVVSDGGFKTRLGPLTLANGYNGIVTLPGGKNFRQVNLEVLGTVMRQLKNGLTNFIGWAASDNYTFFGQANWNNRPLSELPTEKATIIAVGKKAMVLSAEEQQWLEAQVKAFTGQSDIRIGWEQIMSDTVKQQKIIDMIKEKGYQGAINKRILDERLEFLGTFAAETQQGTMSWFGEKVEMKGFAVNLKLVRAANQNGGYIYKNVFLEFVNKEFILKLYERLSKIEMHNPKTGEVIRNKDGVAAKLDNLPVSFMQTILQSRFMGMTEWMETGVMPPRSSTVRKEDWKKLRSGKIAESDWMVIFGIVETLFDEEEKAGRGNVYVIDMGEGAVWIDAGDLEKIVELMRFVANTETGRYIGELPELKVNIINSQISETLNSHISPNSYLENVVATGEGTLLVRDGVVLRDVILPEIPKGEMLEISEGVIISESDLSMLTKLKLGKGAVINRYFAEDSSELAVGPNELVVSVNVKTVRGNNRVKTPGVVIALPYKGNNLAELLLSREIWWSKFVQDIHKDIPELAKAGMGAYTDWENLQKNYPQIGELLKSKKVSLMGLLTGKDIEKLSLNAAAKKDVISRLEQIGIKIQQRWQALIKLHPKILKQYAKTDITSTELVTGVDWLTMETEVIQLKDEELGEQDFDKAQRNTDYNWMDRKIKKLRWELQAKITAPFTGTSNGNWLRWANGPSTKVKQEPSPLMMSLRALESAI